MQPQMDILLIGASVRAAAASLARLGYRPIAFDLFNDLDLAAIADSNRLEAADYPARIDQHVGHLPPMSWMYTGAMENYPAVVDALSQRFRLLGNDGSVLQRVKDPFQVAAVVQDAGLGTPEVRHDGTKLPIDASWLAKPFKSGGGEGIMRWRGGSSPDPDAMFFQQRITGTSCAAIFVRTGASTQLVGVTRQYLGQGGNRFAYRGSLGPWPLARLVEQEIADLGQVIGTEFKLIGVFGIDLVIDKERIWLIEVNPRYTASVEVLEIALGRSIMAEHLSACSPSTHTINKSIRSTSCQFASKALLIAHKAGRLTKPIELCPDIADVPPVGTCFEPGHPILTVYGAGETLSACLHHLGRRLHYWKRTINLEPGLSNLGIDHEKHGHGEDQDAQDHPRQPERLDRDLAE